MITITYWLHYLRYSFMIILRFMCYVQAYFTLLMFYVAYVTASY